MSDPKGSNPPGPPAGSPPAQPSVQIQIELDPEMAQGAYVNMAMVNHTEGEFTLDFIYVQPQAPKAKDFTNKRAYRNATHDRCRQGNESPQVRRSCQGRAFLPLP